MTNLLFCFLSEAVRYAIVSETGMVGFDMKKKEKQIFSGIELLPNGHASDHITPGCMVLEGGAFRGLYTAGVLDALMEADINLSCTVGVSAGAMNGVHYVSGQIGRSARLNLRYRHDSNYVGRKAYFRNRGVIGFDFAFHEFGKEDPLDARTFWNPKRRYIAVATDCLTGKARYFEKNRCSDIMQAIRASASMPYISRMVMLDGRPYLDGGCACKIPYRYALHEGFGKIVIVRTRPADYRKKLKKQPSRAPYRFYGAYREFARALLHGDQKYNRQCDEIEALEKSGRVFVISPSQPINISRLEGDMEKLGGLYYLGYDDAKRRLKELQEYLAAPTGASTPA